MDRAASLAAILILSLSLGTLSTAKIHRSSAAKNAFKRMQPCPATGQPRDACPGWIIDHIVPLCAGGADAPANMQWQTAANAHLKDLGEWRECAAMRKSAQAAL